MLATVAVFLALGGGAIAATSLKRNSVGPKQLKKGAVTTNKIAGGAVIGASIKDGSISLAKTDNSLHQKCQAGTVYVIGACVDQAPQAPGGVTRGAAETACGARGGRVASAAELASFFTTALGTGPPCTWAFESTGPAEFMVVSNLLAVGVAPGATPYDYRCAFKPLG